MLQLNSALLSIAGEFCGRYSPYQGICLSPGSDGGVYVAATDSKVACIAFDQGGSADQSIVLLPSPDLLRACRGIKTAERLVTIGSDGIPTSCPPSSAQAPNTAMVSTIRKTTGPSKVEIPIQYSSVPFPPLNEVMKGVVDRWSANPQTSPTAGRYDANYLQKAIKGLSALNSSIVLSAFDGGPMRLQTDDGSVVLLLMPQTAESIPPVPDWILSYAKN